MTQDWYQCDEETYNSNLDPEEQVTVIPAKHKRARLDMVEAVTLRCPDCGELCINSRGSQMIIRDDVAGNAVRCEQCDKSLSIPANVVRLFAGR